MASDAPSTGAAARPSTAASSGGLVVAVYGAKGGLGATTIARALAHELAAADTDRSVALAELDAKAMARKRVASAVATDGDAPSERIELDVPDVVVARTCTGVWTMASPARHRSAPAPDVKSMAAVIEQLRRRFDLSVLSVGHQMSDRALAALDGSDRVILVTQLTVAALRATQRSLRLLRGLSFPHDKLLVLVNRYEPRDALGAPDAGAVLRHEVFWKLPNDPELSASDAAADSLATAPQSALSRSMRQLAGRIVDDARGMARS